MKKGILVVMILLALFVVTGCDKKQTLSCSNSQKTTGMTINTKVKTVFINDKINDMNMNMEVVIDENYKQYIDTIKDGLNKQYSKYKNDKGFKYNVKVKNNVITFDMTMDAKKISKETKNGLGFSGSEKYSANRKSFENSGYKCK